MQSMLNCQGIYVTIHDRHIGETSVLVCEYTSQMTITVTTLLLCYNFTTLLLFEVDDYSCNQLL